MINTWGRKKKHFKLWNYCLDKGKKYDERFVSFVLQKIATVSSNRWLTLFSNDIEKKTTETCPFVNSVTKMGEIETQKGMQTLNRSKRLEFKSQIERKRLWYTRNSLERGGRVVVVVAEPGHSIRSVVWIQAGQYTYSLDGDSRPKWNGGPCCCHLCTVQEGEP